MFVRDLAEQILGRFRLIDEASTVQVAADALANPRLGLVVVQDAEQRASGVVSKSDLVRHLARAESVALPVTAVMTRTVITVSPADDLHATWQYMVRQRLQNLPVVGPDRRPVGTLDIRDALAAILEQEESQEQALINYIAGYGYN
jgi:CBS domain-containing protein